MKETVSFNYAVRTLDADGNVMREQTVEGGGSTITIEDLTRLSFGGVDALEVECTGVEGESFAIGNAAEEDNE